MIIDFGKKYKGHQISECDTKYLQWLVSHAKVLALRNRWASRDAAFELQRRAQTAAEASETVRIAEEIIASAMKEKTMKTEKYQILDIMDDGKSLEIMRQGSFMPGCIDVDSSLVERARNLRIGQVAMLGLSDEKQWNSKRVIEIAQK
jgi:hypothetical protein